MTYGEQMRRAPRVVSLLAVVGIASAAAIGLTPTAQASAPLEPYYSQSLQWSSCADHRECSSMLVPIDYASPSSGDFRIALSRVRAKGTKVGSIVVNPGGPGAEGASFVEYAQSSMGDQVAKNYDIVGFDPRGVGKSAPVTCLTGKQTTTWLRADATPDTSSEIATYSNQIGRAHV